MQVKMYYFRYANKFDKLLQGFLQFGTNFCVPILASFAFAFMIGFVGLGKYVDAGFATGVVLCSIVVGIFCALRYCFSFKGVILYDEHMEIITHSLGFGKSKPKIIINYVDIYSAYNSTFDLMYDRKKSTRSFIVGDHKTILNSLCSAESNFVFRSIIKMIFTTNYYCAVMQSMKKRIQTATITINYAIKAVNTIPRNYPN